MRQPLLPLLLRCAQVSGRSNVWEGAATNLGTSGHPSSRGTCSYGADCRGNSYPDGHRGAPVILVDLFGGILNVKHNCEYTALSVWSSNV